MRKLFFLMLVLMLPTLNQCSHEPEFNYNEPWRTRLYSPTMMDKVDGVWFLIDTWHHRILFRNDFSRDLTEWQTLTESASGPHSIASDGDLILYDNTGRGELQGVRKVQLNGEIVMAETNSIPNMGSRPHRIIYDEATSRFYVIASTSQQILRLKNVDGQAVLEDDFSAEFLEGVYSRSLTIIDDKMYILTGAGRLTELTYRQGEYNVLQTFQMPANHTNLIDLFYSSNDWYYITSRQGGIIRSRELAGFETGDFEHLDSALGLNGAPYYLTEIDGRIVVPFTDYYNGVLSFEEDGAGGIVNIEKLFDFGPPSVADFLRKQIGPL